MEIYTVEIVNQSEQVAIISTKRGWHISYVIPDARRDRTSDLPLSKKFNTYHEALTSWEKQYKEGW